jgi:hypothetical protein
MSDTRPLLRDLLGSSGSDPGCDVWAEILDQIVEAEAAGRTLAEAFPDYGRHLESCPDCDEDHDALLNLLRTQAADRPQHPS